ncbi:uncharacterized protein LOC114362309 [Ostrinia furnacalis]|uniref:uncharacterized protein LOC114362309 n=1 Tax=Ostrinia furnacalis TaxID=93504 RepID=UPI00103F7D33|nr:uncharacterized protein LOC114362309 [Ostrinia furnacalis]
MDKYEAIAFLFNIAKEIKRSFESPVILVTSKDYADGIYRSLLEIRTALLQDADSRQVAEIINNFHLQWLQAVKDIEDFRKRIKDTPREVILNALEYTIRSMNNRFSYFNNFIQQLRATMPTQDRLIMQADLEIMNDMKETVISVLHDKKHCFKIQVDNYEYAVKLNYEIDELLNWLDRINDSLAIQFCKVIHLHVPQLPSDLTKTLKQIIDEVAGSSLPEAPEIIERMESKGKLLSSMVRFNASHELEVSKVVEKIKTLEDRISRLQEKKSSAVLALQHKVIYLEERLQSLENLKMSLNALKMEQSRVLEEDEVLDSTELHIFNHNLPEEDRCRLVERLVKLWDNALNNDDPTGKSIISILSAVDMKEVFTDDVGEFTVDKYGRKLYSRSDGNLYQLNERNELVEVNDDEKHVYFYDDCGRYYVDRRGHRIYKAHDDASEYELGHMGQLLKLREIRDGIEYRYDHRGRYFIDENGRRIYTDPDTGEKYELDGFGNLVRVHSRECLYVRCPPEPMYVKECKYLQETVGDALKTCLSNVILHQPADPIEFLASNLEKYRKNVQDRQKRREEEIEMKAERQFYETASVPLQSYVSEAEGISGSFSDSNLATYETMIPE